MILECPSSVVRRAPCVVRRSSCGVNNCSVYTLQVTVFFQSSSNLLRMFVLTTSRTSSKMGKVRSKTRSLGQIIVKSCIHSRSHIFSPIFLKLAQNVCLNNILDEFENGSSQTKSRSLGHINGKPCFSL